MSDERPETKDIGYDSGESWKKVYHEMGVKSRYQESF